MRLLISQWNEETNLSLQPPQVRVITVLNTHGFLKRLMTNITIYYRHIIVSPCMDITALLYWNAHNIDLCNRSLQPSQVSIVAENVLWQVVQLVVTQVPVRKNWYICVKYIRFSILMTDTCIKKKKNRFYFFPKSMFRLRTNFSLRGWKNGSTNQLWSNKQLSS